MDIMNQHPEEVDGTREKMREAATKLYTKKREKQLREVLNENKH